MTGLNATVRKLLSDPDPMFPRRSSLTLPRHMVFSYHNLDQPFLPEPSARECRFHIVIKKRPRSCSVSEGQAALSPLGIGGHVGIWVSACSLLLAFCLAGCSFKSIALRSAVDIIGKGIEVFYEESDVVLAEDSMASQLKLLEILLKNDPRNANLLLFVTQGFGAYAFMFLEGKENERAKGFYVRGRNFGIRTLQKKSSLDFLAESDLDQFDRGLKKLSRKEVPLLFWSAYCWGGHANLSRDNPAALADLPKIERMMLRVNELLPGYFYSGADIFLGSYYGSKPKMFGGNLKKSKFYFDRALAVSDEKFLMGIVLYARHYAIPSQDRGYFKLLLENVLNFSAESFPEQRLANEVAKKRALKLLKEIDEYF